MAATHPTSTHTTDVNRPQGARRAHRVSERGARAPHGALLSGALLSGALLSGALLWAVTLQGCGEQGGGGQVTEVTAALEGDLSFLREEEKLARDVYLYADAKYGAGPFANISSSEQQHLDAVSGLVASAGFVDERFDPSPGAFHDETLMGLYEELTQRVDVSYAEALRVGALIEDLDIVDIEEKRARTTDPAVLRVYERLQCGSRNHLRSFVGALEGEGERFEVVYLTPAQAEEILAGDRESCGG